MEWSTIVGIVIGAAVVLSLLFALKRERSIRKRIEIEEADEARYEDPVYRKAMVDVENLLAKWHKEG